MDRDLKTAGSRQQYEGTTHQYAHPEGLSVERVRVHRLRLAPARGNLETPMNNEEKNSCSKSPIGATPRRPS